MFCGGCVERTELSGNRVNPVANGTIMVSLLVLGGVAPRNFLSIQTLTSTSLRKASSLALPDSSAAAMTDHTMANTNHFSARPRYPSASFSRPLPVTRKVHVSQKDDCRTCASLVRSVQATSTYCRERHAKLFTETRKNKKRQHAVSRWAFKPNLILPWEIIYQRVFIAAPMRNVVSPQ